MGQSTEGPKRGNGTGSVYPYRNGFRAAFTWRDDAGRLHRTVVSAPTKDAADRKLVRLRDDYENGKPPPDTGTVGEYLRRWLETAKHDVRPSTWRQRDQTMRSHVIPTIGRLRLAKLAPADVEAMTSGMIASGLSPTTAALSRVILRRALADAQRDGLVHRNVAALARPPRKVRPDLHYLSTDQIRALLDKTTEHDLGPLVAVAVTTGLRQGELLGLRWQDVDLDAGTLTVRRAMARQWDGTHQLAEPKTSRSRRTIDLPARAVAALRTEQDRQTARKAAIGARDWQDRDGLVFTDVTGRPLSRDVARRLPVLLKMAGIPVQDTPKGPRSDIRWHDLRHSAASAMLAAGVPLKVVSETLGHSTITITADLYAHVAPALRRDAADALDRALA